MNFDQFINRIPGLKRATTHEDSKKILAFFESNASSQKQFSIFYDRAPSIFTLGELSSPHFFLASFEDQNGETEGVFSCTLLKSVGFDTLYIGDLKIKAKSEEIKKKWRAVSENLIEDLHEIEEFKNVKFIHMVMMDDNTKAYERLVTRNLMSYKYQKVHSYKMVNILALKWWKPNLENSYLHSIYEKDKNKIYEVLQGSSHNKFGSNHIDLLKYRAEKIQEMAKVLEIKDRQGNILLMATLEDISPAKRILIKRLPFSLKFFSFLSPIFRCKRYSEKQDLDILYFSNFTFHPSLLNDQKKRSSVLNYALKVTCQLSNKHFHIISLSVFPGEEDLLVELRKYFMVNVESLGFYSLQPSSWGSEFPKIPLPNFNMSYI